MGGGRKVVVSVRAFFFFRAEDRVYLCLAMWVYKCDGLLNDVVGCWGNLVNETLVHTLLY